LFHLLGVKQRASSKKRKTHDGRCWEAGDEKVMSTTAFSRAIDKRIIPDGKEGYEGFDFVSVSNVSKQKS
jgi:hypothetical protein